MVDRYSIQELKDIVAPLAQKYGAQRVYLFGSYARGEATSASDLDFRIEKGELRSLLQLAGFQLDLESSFSKKLDVLTTQMLTPQFLSSIRPEEVLIYAQG